MVIEFNRLDNLVLFMVPLESDPNQVLFFEGHFVKVLSHFEDYNLHVVICNSKTVNIRAKRRRNRLQNVAFLFPLMNNLLLIQLQDWRQILTAWEERLLNPVGIVRELGLLFVKWFQFFLCPLERKHIFAAYLLYFICFQNDSFGKYLLDRIRLASIKRSILYFYRC